MKIFEFVNKPSGVYGLNGIPLVPEDLLLIENDIYNLDLGEDINDALLNANNPSSLNPFVTQNDVINDKNFVFIQSVPSATWNINHNLNKLPSVTVIDTGNNEVMGDIQYVDNNNIIITFSGGFAGKASLN